jgi:hypothetical protein
MKTGVRSDDNAASGKDRIMTNGAEGDIQLHDNHAIRQCITCVYYYLDEEANLEKCMRFARFVEHVITDTTRDCSYWTAIADR